MTSIVDGSAVTRGCYCDTNDHACSFPCWMRVGLTTDPCRDPQHRKCEPTLPDPEDD